MASIKISHLPQLTEGTLTDDDQFVINDANQTTSRLGYGVFKTSFLSSNLTFSGSVNITGDLTITESVTSNVPTKGQVTTEIQTEIDRAVAAEAALGVRIDGVTNGVALLAAAENTFIGNLEVNGALTQGGSSVATIQDLVNVAVKTAPESIFTGNVEVNGVLTQAGSAVQTTASLAATYATVASNTVLAQKGVDDAADAQTDASAAVATGLDLGTQIGSIADAPTSTTINGKLNATGAGLNEVKSAAAVALAAFQDGSADTDSKLNACQTFFNTVMEINVTAFSL